MDTGVIILAADRLMHQPHLCLQHLTNFAEVSANSSVYVLYDN